MALSGPVRPPVRDARAFLSLPPVGDLVRFSRLLALTLLFVPAALRSQERAVDSTAARAPVPPIPVGPAIRSWPALDTLPGAVLPSLPAFGRLAPGRRSGELVADANARGIELATRRRITDMWARAVGAGFIPSPTIPTGPDPAVAAAVAAASASRDGSSRTDIFTEYADLGMQLNARLEAKAERDKNERCSASQAFNPIANCSGTFQPQFDFQFNVKTGGVVADRVHVNVDYDSEREFDASNNISVYYEGKSDELLHRLEVGNVSFQPPPSRFITAGIPSGNYGLQAIGQLGPMRFRTIVAQQKGNVVKDRIFTVGDRTLQSVDRDVEDYQVEPRRFFFVIDPRQLGGYPNVDILDGRRLAELSARLPADQRPSKIFVYRQLIGAQPSNPNGPRLSVRGARNESRQTYEYLREGVDYYLDPSNLWISLVRPLGLNSERLAVAYTVGSGQRTAAGGTPDIEQQPDTQIANLLWEPELTPADSAYFLREIRSVYRMGGDDIRRETVMLRITTGTSGDQEKPVGSTATTFLELFGIAQTSNGNTFDVDNRLWPRPSDPNFNRNAGGSSAKLIRDYFVIFPSLRPFARNGLAPLPNAANDTIYTAPGEDLYSQRRPQAIYHLRARYQAEGSGDAGSLSLGSVQVRPNSERLIIAGVPLTRGTDYSVDYELGRVTFARPDTLFPQARQVTVRYEENPLFATAPTSIFGLATQFPMANGQLNFTAISQSQKTTFNRPPLGFEPASSLVAGVSGNFTFDAAPLTRALERLPLVTATAPSRIDVSGEFATSRPQPNAAGQAYVESFEGEGGVQVPLADAVWYFGSRPLPTPSLLAASGGTPLDTTRATTLAWQNNGVDGSGNAQIFTFEQIDPLVTTTGGSFRSPEPLLWLTLYPLAIGGLRHTDPGTQRSDFAWKIPDAPAGRRWRSIRTALGGGGGVDLSRVETLEYWALLQVDAGKRARNPVMVLDFGDISENTVTFAPETLVVRANPLAPSSPDSVYRGKKIVGFDTLDTERDPFSFSFNAAENDVGLPGDVVPNLVVIDSINTPNIAQTVARFETCSGGAQFVRVIGDSRSNCTVRNNRLDEEDLDLDRVLNIPSSRETSETWRRYTVDLSDNRNFARTGSCYSLASGDTVGGVPVLDRACWVLVRVPFRAPNDSLGAPNLRRVKSLRMSVVSGAGLGDARFSTVPIARLRLVGSPWVKRADRFVQGAGGEETANGFVIAGIIGTQDRDTTSGIFYESPPGVTDEADTKQTGLENTRVQINERSMRLLAGPGGAMRTYDRAEAYYRFPEGQKNFMGYTELRVWAKGQGNGWGPGGELQFYVKIGRDANNFYMYRTEVSSAPGVTGWTPEVVVDFRKLFALRARIQNAFLQGSARQTCTGLDSALVARSRPPAGGADTSIYAACADGYIVYTSEPGVSPPNLAAVQELAVGMIRVDSATGMNRILPSDTLEVWVDDIRLTGVVDTPGYAGQLGLSVVAGDIADVRVNVSRRDPNFRQLAEQPSFVQESSLDLATAVHVDKFLPASLGLSLPFTVSHQRSGSSPLFISRSDLRGDGIEGLRTPEAASTAYSLGVRRAVPLRGSIFAPIVNNLSLNGGYLTGRNQSEYNTGTSSSLNVAAEYRLVSEGRTHKMPGWLDRTILHLPDWLANTTALRSVRGASLRFNPTQLALTSAVVHSLDRQRSFQKPAAVSTDTARASRNLNYLWRNGSSLELRPVGSLSMRWSVNSLRDLRQYGDTNATAVVATGERDKLLGMDVGLERERQMLSGISFAPSVSPWIRPRLDFGTSYGITRNPNDRTVLRANDSTGAFRLPRRFNNSQTFSLGASFDLGRAILTYTSDKSVVRRLVNVFQPVDVSWNRSLLSTFDASPFTPSLGYQFALGNSGDFRSESGRLATSAGVTRNLSASGRMGLPYGLSVGNRYQRVGTRSWTRRVNDTQGVLDGLTVTFPDATLSWSFQPALLRRVFTSLGTNLSYAQVRQSSFAPSEQADRGAEVSDSRSRSWRANPSVVWNVFGGLSTAGGYGRSIREDGRPGSQSTSRSDELSADLAKGFKLPTDWKAKSDLRTRFSYQYTHGQAYVLNTASETNRSRLSDNGRRAFNLNADTDFADNLTGSFTMSRVISFDNNFNRRFTQTVITAVLNIRFFAGELK